MHARTHTHTYTLVVATPEVLVEQTDFDVIQVSWNTAITSIPEDGYITINSTDNSSTNTFNVTSVPFNISLQPGEYSLQLFPLSQLRLYIELAQPMEFTVKGMVSK